MVYLGPVGGPGVEEAGDGVDATVEEFRGGEASAIVKVAAGEVGGEVLEFEANDEEGSSEGIALAREPGDVGVGSGGEVGNAAVVAVADLRVLVGVGVEPAEALGVVVW